MAESDQKPETKLFTLFLAIFKYYVNQVFRTRPKFKPFHHTVIESSIKQCEQLSTISAYTQSRSTCQNCIDF